MGDDTLNQAQEEGQVAEAVADDARPRTFCPLSHKRKCETCDCHPDRVPESRLHEKVESLPAEAVHNPRSPAECQFLPGQHITAPPQFLPADVAHQHHDRVVHGDPPGPMQGEANEVVWAEMAEELAVERRGIEESYGL